MLISVTPAALRAPGALVPDQYLDQHVKPAEADQMLVQGMRAAALNWIEGRTKLALEQREFTAVYEGFDEPLLLPRTPASALLGISYTDLTGTAVDVTARGWLAGNTVRMARGQCWPAFRFISVRFLAGFATPADVPPLLPIATVMITRHLYDGGTTDDVPPTILSLIDDQFRTPVIAS